MKLSTSTGHLFGTLGEDEGLKALKNAGYDALDLTLCNMSTNSDSPFAQKNAIEHAEALGKKVRELGMFFNQSHTPFEFNWKNPNEFEERFMPLNIKGLEVSAAAGAEIAIVHPFHYSEYIGHEEEIFEKNMKFYRTLLPIAKGLGIKIAIENMWRREPKRKYICPSACGTPEEFIRYIDTLDSEYIVGCLDLGHCSLVGIEPQDWIRAMGKDRIKSLHVHDNSYTGDDHTLPGMGKMEWENIARALADIDYSGDFTYEADAFLRNFEPEFKPMAVRFMVERGRYLINKIESFK